MPRNISQYVALLFGAAALGACQTSQGAHPAALENADPQTMAKIRATLADAMGTASVELGPGDLTATSTISVLPARPSPHEDRSTVRPTQFDMVMRGARCYAVRRDTGEEYPLDGVSCRVLAS